MEQPENLYAWSMDMNNGGQIALGIAGWRQAKGGKSGQL